MSVIYTIGHSTRSVEDFIAILKAHGVTLVADVRTMPRSRHNAQFNLDALPATLAAAGIGYRHFPELGGLRRARRDSPNQGWRNQSFRGYADYMQTPPFLEGLENLIAAAAGTIAIMCAEAVPWRCHRSLISDALLVRGFDVRDIMSARDAKPHKLTPFAVVNGVSITYPEPIVSAASE